MYLYPAEIRFAISKSRTSSLTSIRNLILKWFAYQSDFTFGLVNRNTRSKRDDARNKGEIQEDLLRASRVVETL